jgi:hypothetical protein
MIGKIISYYRIVEELGRGGIPQSRDRLCPGITRRMKDKYDR